MRKFLASVLVVAFTFGWWTPFLYAFDTAFPVTACTVTAASASFANVASAVTSVIGNVGATVCVPANTSDAWGPGFAIPNNMGITIAGCAAVSGCVGTTTITGNMISMTNTTTPWRGSRVTGFTFIPTSYATLTAQIGYRYDHNIITRASWSQTFLVIGSLVGGVSASPSEGLIDHNTMTNTRTVYFGEFSDTGGHQRWAEALNLGTVHGNYYEDNTCVNTTGWNGCIDTNLGGRYAARYNTFTDTYLEAHSIQGDGIRGNRLTESHNNTFNQSAIAAARLALLRGGVQYHFHNTYNGVWPDLVRTFALDNVRSCDDSLAAAYPVWGVANGSSVIDGAGASGYRVRDQIGASTDSFFMTGKGLTGGPFPTQPLVASAFWRNTATSYGEVNPGYNTCVTGRLPDIVQDDRDYYKDSTVVNAATPQTTGVREGTHAQRPASCTAGVYYWETDTGEWNATNGATADGQLFKCTSTNVWEAYYIPYSYPHPLQGAATPPAPDAIATSYVAAFRGPTFAAIIWSRSTDANHKAYNIYRCPTSAACLNLVKTITPASAAAAHSPETQWIDTSLYVAGQNCYSVPDVNTLDYVGPATTPSCLTVTGKQ